MWVPTSLYVTIEEAKPGVQTEFLLPEISKIIFIIIMQ